MFCNIGVGSTDKNIKMASIYAQKGRINVQTELNGYRPSIVEALLCAFGSYTHLMRRRLAKNQHIQHNFHQLKFDLLIEAGTSGL